MELKAFTPDHPLLQRYIACFYTLKRASDEPEDVYTTFPNIFSILSANRFSNVRVVGNVKTVRPSPTGRPETILVCPSPAPAEIHYRGEVDEISIYFKPLGINAFIDSALRRYCEDDSNQFSPFDDYQRRIEDIFSIRSNEERIRALQQYLLSKHVGFSHPFLPNVVHQLMDSSNTSSISQIARAIGISRTTLIKHFGSHLCATPLHFRKIARFRTAIEQHRLQVSKNNLTQTSAAADYFDQSHMIKDFRSLTEHSPKRFFAKISHLEGGRINWMLA